MFDEEQVKENEAKEYCKSIGAIYYTTSAYLNSGIEQLFREIGYKYLTKFLSGNNTAGGNQQQDGNKNSVQLNENNQRKEKKCC